MKAWLAFLGIVALFGFSWLMRSQLGQQPDGSYLVSSGQRIELLGQTTLIQGVRPKDLSLSPDQSLVAILTHGRLIVSVPSGRTISEIDLSAGPLGISWSPDGRRIYCSLGTGKVGVFTWNGKDLAKSAQWDVAPKGAKGNPGTCGLVAGPNGVLYAALSVRNEVVAITPAGEISCSWRTGACPYCLALSPDGHTLAVANRGGTIIAPNPEQGDPATRQQFEGTGIANSLSAGTAVQIDPRTDASLAGTVSLINLEQPNLTAKSVAVGRQPSGMAFAPNCRVLYVADSDEDAISLVDVEHQTEMGRFSITPKEDPGFGQIPTSVALSPDGNRIYVALGGSSSIAVLTGATSPKLIGYFPTAWYPISVLSVKDLILVASAKGIGSRPSSKTTGYGVHDSVGAFQAFSTQDISDIKSLTRKVARNNSWSNAKIPRKNRQPTTVPERLGEPSLFTHVVYIVKENLSYDTAMGDMATGNGDASLCTFPENVTPNHHELAKRFGLLDNFYISGTNSADGHQWVDSAIANDYTERNYGANARSYPYDGGDPLAFSPAGFLWSQARAAGKTVRVFGEFVDKPSIVDSRTGKTPDWSRCWEDYKNGQGEVVIKAGTSEVGLRENLDPNYIGFPLNVSDQWRADLYIRELKTWESKNRMPDLSILLLPNDHTGGTRPGWPTPRAEVADNDLALGRIIEAISRSIFWSTTLVIVAEDDSQNGLDHVDGHRSICFCISPYSRPNVTNNDIYNHVSIASTIGRVLGMPPMTRFDRTIKPMFGCFGDKADLSPYVTVPNRIPLDELNPPLKRLQSKQERVLAEACNTMDWSTPDTQNQDTLNRAVWLSEARRSVGKAGYSTSFPTLRRP